MIFVVLMAVVAGTKPQFSGVWTDNRRRTGGVRPTPPPPLLVVFTGAAAAVRGVRPLCDEYL